MEIGKKIIFRCSCPVLNCLNDKIIYWKHKGCSNGTETLDINGFLECEQCGTKAFINNWYFNCADGTNTLGEKSNVEKAKLIMLLGALPNVSDMLDDCEMLLLVKAIKNIKIKGDNY